MSKRRSERSLNKDNFEDEEVPEVDEHEQFSMASAEELKNRPIRQPRQRKSLASLPSAERMNPFGNLGGGSDTQPKTPAPTRTQTLATASFTFGAKPDSAPPQNPFSGIKPFGGPDASTTTLSLAPGRAPVSVPFAPASGQLFGLPNGGAAGTVPSMTPFGTPRPNTAAAGSMPVFHAPSGLNSKAQTKDAPAGDGPTAIANGSSAAKLDAATTSRLESLVKQIRGLNESFAAHVRSLVTDDAFQDLSAVFASYTSQRKDIVAKFADVEKHLPPKPAAPASAPGFVMPTAEPADRPVEKPSDKPAAKAADESANKPSMPKPPVPPANASGIAPFTFSTSGTSTGSMSTFVPPKPPAVPSFGFAATPTSTSATAAAVSFGATTAATPATSAPLPAFGASSTPSFGTVTKPDAVTTASASPALPAPTTAPLFSFTSPAGAAVSAGSAGSAKPAFGGFSALADTSSSESVPASKTTPFSFLPPVPKAPEEPKPAGTAVKPFGLAAPSNPAADAPKPAPTSFTFGSSGTTTAFTFGGVASAPATATFSFLGGGAAAPAPAAAQPSGGEGGGGDGDDDDAAPPDEQIGDALLTGEGEQEETTEYEVRAKLFLPEDQGKWVAKGVGPFRIKRNKATGKMRLLMRLDNVGHLLLNAAVFKEMPVSTVASEQVSIMAPGLDGKLTKMLLRVKNKELAAELVAALGKAKAA
ncbi:hypothetical protein HK105_202336 [Polyrhizophydium stewartii]|uniref:RanBD1 domain-containing protein n=1 Tax=Polyrhizophydium stewartii TaxID=2732419 RepID=A0ABR4NEG6_9FUNG